MPGFRSIDLSTDDGSASKAARAGLDDLRSALRWAFDTTGRPLTRELVFAALPPLTHLGLTFEFKTWIARALVAESDPRGRLSLSIGLGKAVHLLQSESVTQCRLYGEAYELAKELGDIPGAPQALRGMTTTRQALHQPRRMIEAATQFYDFAVVNDHSADAMVGECLMATACQENGTISLWISPDAGGDPEIKGVRNRYGVGESKQALSCGIDRLEIEHRMLFEHCADDVATATELGCNRVREDHQLSGHRRSH